MAELLVSIDDVAMVPRIRRVIRSLHVELKHGMPANSILMTIREALSEFAKKNIVE